MNNPRRLIDEGLDDFERSLLAAGRRDAMPPSSRSRILVGLGLGALVPSTAVAASVNGAAKGTIFGLSAATGVKLAVGGAVGALAIWSSVALMQGGQGAPVVELPPVRMADAPVVERVAEPSPVEEQPAAPEQEAVAEEVTPRIPVGTKQTADDLGRELESLDQARAALRGGDADRCLQLLREHARKFPRQRMAVEASVLRIEALAKSGNQEAARKAGQAFLAKHPKGPYAQRVTSLIGADRGDSE
jgi:hypothetical protein